MKRHTKRVKLPVSKYVLRYVNKKIAVHTASQQLLPTNNIRRPSRTPLPQTRNHSRLAACIKCEAILGYASMTERQDLMCLHVAVDASITLSCGNKVRPPTCLGLTHLGSIMAVQGANDQAVIGSLRNSMVPCSRLRHFDGQQLLTPFLVPAAKAVATVALAIARGTGITVLVVEVRPDNGDNSYGYIIAVILVDPSAPRSPADRC